jgi:hypothetical protein
MVATKNRVSKSRLPKVADRRHNQGLKAGVYTRGDAPNVAAQ